MKENLIEKRIQNNYIVPDFVYSNGILNIAFILFDDLEKLLFLEQRYFGITVIYMNTVKRIQSKIKKQETDEDREIYGRILYMYKPLIMREYKKLRKRKVTSADCVISILKKLLEIIVENKDDQYHKSIKTLYKIVKKLFNNIRNGGKNSNMYYLISSIKNYMNSGQIGKYAIDSFSVIDEELKKEQNKSIVGSGIKINEAGNNQVKEITWTDE